MRAVARAAGVAPAAIYLHFPDRAALVFAVCERHFAALDESVEAAAATTDDPLESLRRRGEAYIRFGLDNPEPYRILFMGQAGASPADWTSERLASSAAFDHLVDAVVRCVDAGVLATEDPVLVAVGLWVTVHGLTSLLIAKPDFPWPQLDAVIDHVLTTHAAGLLSGVSTGDRPPRRR